MPTPRQHRCWNYLTRVSEQRHESAVSNEHLKQIENRSKEIEDVKKRQMQILRLKNPITRNKILKLSWWAQWHSREDPGNSQ